MDKSWRCSSCLVVNSHDAEECECCMQKRSTEATNENSSVGVTTNGNACSDKDGASGVKDDHVKDGEKNKKKEKNEEISSINSVEDTKNNDKLNGNKEMFNGGGFMPSLKSTNDKETSSSKSIFLTGIANSNTTTGTTTAATAVSAAAAPSNEDGSYTKQNKTQQNSVGEKGKRSVAKNKEKRKVDKRERAPSTRIQPTRKCTQKKICYKT
ncbi:conserved Plasmodium protein, unknown function [Plasmodium ovale]|uniref:RanBP2-type domain-containing protein n=2 Tax=Plasmodium ovale TaxID=36330 RepID=A0A1A8WYK5_PLAOA|nr:hypothetical protein POVCU2_0046570 [Plasmodium ovale curtisi]SBS98058.1 hypothetical protein POVCU1_043150 [Plasmodium ovale curtisi]SCQ16816.1 conserved Plasmodium protein, unknown function [Plasmodium ovale]